VTRNGRTNLARLLARRVDGIHLAPFEQGEIGPDLFRHACLMGLEGLVSKHRDSFYRAGRFDRWVKVKNRQASGVQPGDGLLTVFALFVETESIWRMFKSEQTG
jgi:ATP-dependent DNA ligase